MDITREMDKKFPDYTDSERKSVREKQKMRTKPGN